ncbi:acetyl/propionyl/methylcrotonyl-CoA carboxylase subunit alpha [Ferrimonas gelatinilytica]|uniref:Acetyl/propionyl/methylcrotonyl-CoA carboxylase subunit alpha n=1 Tax=Ferrimonas gelatinilytica TaxID=1255257 RepID=A0ABP9SCM8_9GAMM
MIPNQSSSRHPIRKVLIANRGEIACRVIRTCQAQGIRTVAVYSDADRHSLHVQQADQAFRLGPAPVADSYLRSDAILAIARRSECDAIHPGYGFLSENPDFARACEQAGILFIGPGADAIDKMGSKSAAKAIMAAAGVPMLPGYHGDDQSDTRLIAEAEKIGFPLLVKAAFGGGGKGMRIVQESKGLPEALASARREAQSAFGNPHLLLERYLTTARHIEVQVFADSKGNCLYLSDRDCSIQRRHQKVVEEAPAPGLCDALRREMGEASVRAAKAIDYVGAGTVEYLLDDQGRFYFMEMNTRLQVEHPVTESVTGLDLVAWQLAVAAGEPLPLRQSEVQTQGHAIEVRLYAEDPHRDFLPASGQLKHLQWPGAGVRIDTGVTQGDSITPFYDPMIAKIIVAGANRAEACRNLAQALRQTRLSGPVVNLGFLLHIAEHPAFIGAQLDTGFIPRHLDQLLAPPKDRELAATATALYLLTSAASEDEAALLGWRLNAPRQLRLVLEDDQGQTQDLAFQGRPDGAWADSQGRRLALHCNEAQLQLSCDDTLLRWPFHQDDDGSVTLQLADGPLRLRRYRYRPQQEAGDAAKALQAPMNGTHVANLVEVGDEVEAGTALVVMEAMKMEYTISAPYAGQVTALPFKSGDSVSDGSPLVVLRDTAATAECEEANA